MNNKRKLEIIHLCKKNGSNFTNLLNYWCQYTGHKKEDYDDNIKIKFFLPKLIQICNECCSPAEFEIYVYSSYFSTFNSPVEYWCSQILNLEKTKYQKYHHDN